MAVAARRNALILLGSGLILFFAILTTGCSREPDQTPPPYEGTIEVLETEHAILLTKVGEMRETTPVPARTEVPPTGTDEPTRGATLTPVEVDVIREILPAPVYFLSTEDVWKIFRDGLRQEQVTFEDAPVLDYDILPDGKLAFITGERLVLSHASGGQPELIATSVPDNDTLLWHYAQELYTPRLSPNRRYIAYGQNGLNLYDLVNRTYKQVAANGLPLEGDETSAYRFAPYTWSPDSQRLVFIKGSEDELSAFVLDTGTGEMDEVLKDVTGAAWTQDGRSLVLARDTDGCSQENIYPAVQQTSGGVAISHSQLVEGHVSAAGIVDVR